MSSEKTIGEKVRDLTRSFIEDLESTKGNPVSRSEITEKSYVKSVLEDLIQRKNQLCLQKLEGLLESTEAKDYERTKGTSVMDDIGGFTSANRLLEELLEKKYPDYDKGDKSVLDNLRKLTGNGVGLFSVVR